MAGNTYWYYSRYCFNTGLPFISDMGSVFASDLCTRGKLTTVCKRVRNRALRRNSCLLERNTADQEISHSVRHRCEDAWGGYPSARTPIYAVYNFPAGQCLGFLNGHAIWHDMYCANGNTPRKAHLNPQHNKCLHTHRDPMGLPRFSQTHTRCFSDMSTLYTLDSSDIVRFYG